MTKSIIWVDTKKQMDTHTHTHTHTHKHIHTHTHVHMHTHGDRLMQLCHLVVVGVGHKQRTRRGEDTKKKTDGHARAHTRRQTDAAKPPCGCRSRPQAEDQKGRGHKERNRWAHAHTHTCVRTPIHTCARTHVCTHTHKHIQMCVRMHAHTHTHTHTHTPHTHGDRLTQLSHLVVVGVSHKQRTRGREEGHAQRVLQSSLYA